MQQSTEVSHEMDDSKQCEGRSGGLFLADQALRRSRRRFSERAPLLVFTHGNAELIDNFADQFTIPRAAGYAVLLVEYPGYGRSLGGGAACILATSRPVAALILESSFTSVRALGRQLLVPGFLIRDPFDNLVALRSYRGPLLVLHGDRDEVIPVEHGRQLAAAVPVAEFAVLTCGHNDCPRSWETIMTFLSKAFGRANSTSPSR